jgi:tRNA G46 methylase TrmB
MESMQCNTEDITAMQQEEITALFDKQAASYDQQWSTMAPINDALHVLARAVLLHLPPQAHILCVGAGTGAEILYPAQTFPAWQFTALEPSTVMLDVFRRRAEDQGIASRCVFHLPSAAQAQACGVKAARVFCTPNANPLAAMTKLINGGSVQAHVATVLPRTDVNTALQLSKTGHTRGNIVLHMST